MKLLRQYDSRTYKKKRTTLGERLRRFSRNPWVPGSSPTRDTMILGFGNLYKVLIKKPKLKMKSL